MTDPEALDRVRTIARPDWQRIDTVCLDMDGTILDQRFDNQFWLEVLPQQWSARHGMSVEAARAELLQRINAKRGTLQWYCIDYWSDQLQMDFAALKHAMRHEVRYLPGALEFIGRARGLGKRLVLATNAHPVSLAIKDEAAALKQHFDVCVSSHEYGAPKESPAFWRALYSRQGVVPAATLFADDSASVVRAARDAGIAWVYQVLHPDTTQPPQKPLPEVHAIHGIGEIPD
jgi:putative hydrolase of the HAD superfamily